jgi:hypothetical protein
MTAKRCPVLDIFNASKGSFSTECFIKLAGDDSGAESLADRRRRGSSCSTGLMPGVTGGVEAPDGGSSPSSDLTSDTILGAVNSDPLPSVVSRDSASSSDSKIWVVLASLLAAYIRGAPIGQYMAVQCRRSPHSWGRIPTSWHNDVAIAKGT